MITQTLIAILMLGALTIGLAAITNEWAGSDSAGIADGVTLSAPPALRAAAVE